MTTRKRTTKSLAPAAPVRDLAQLLLPARASLLEAMGVIDREGIELALVCDDQQRVIGTLSDGDVRRSILRGTPLQAAGAVKKAMNPRFTSVGMRASRAEALDLMRSLSISVVPVLNETKHLVGLHLLHDLIGASIKPNAAVIMCGGKGTRLRPLTYDIPKPMIAVAGRPILERLVLQLVGSGIREVFLAINYLGEIIEKHFADGQRFGCHIRYLRETKPLGTGGALSLLPRSASEHGVLVMNGDIVTEIDLAQVLQFHDEGQFGLTTVLKPYQVEIPFGVAEVKGDVLLGMYEKPVEQYLVNAGIYVANRNVLELVPRQQDFGMPSLIEAAAAKRIRLGAYKMSGEWIDVGRHETLKQARGQSQS